MFEPVKSHENLSVGIVDQVIKAINNGELKPGDKLPTEREMCTIFSVSRTVIRDALKTMLGLGVVTIRHGVGTFINDVDRLEDFTQLISYLHISRGTSEEMFKVREIIESQVVIWCTQNADEHDICKLGKIVKRGKDAEEKNELKLALLDAEFDLKIVEASGNKVLMRLMINLLDLIEENRSKALMIPGRPCLSVLDHETIIEAIKRRDPLLAQQQMLYHLENVRNAITLK